jgi:Na+-translocating ferredoxin:NAD+ oxidoreductase RnfG subunit
MKALVLFFIGIISGLSIWGANQLTFENIEANELNREKGFYKDLFSIDEATEITFTTDELSDGFYEIIISDNSGVIGYVYKGEDNNNYGKITVLVGIIDGEIENVIISSTTNTPNFVNKIESDYLDPFSGQSTNDVSFDSKTGASYTYGSVTDIVTSATDYYNSERSGE